jgi:hypothetical protein
MPTPEPAPAGHSGRMPGWMTPRPSPSPSPSLAVGEATLSTA